jgi:thioesterase domain-containing protein
LRDGAEPAANLVHPVDGSGAVYQKLADVWAGERRIVALEQGAGFETLSAQAEVYADVVMEAADEAAPILLAGWSLGAVIAAAVSAQLRKAGRDVRLVLLDAAAPSAGDAEIDAAEIEAAAAEAGADAEIAARARDNVRIAAEHRFVSVNGPAAVIKARGTERPGADDGLGWAEVFERLTAKEAAGTHQTLLREGDLAGLTKLIELLWHEQGER